MVPDLSSHDGECDGSLSKYSVKLDGDSYQYTVSLVFQILNPKEAEVLEPYFAGARQGYVNCTEQDNFKEERTVTPEFDEMTFELVNRESARSLIKGAARILKMGMRGSKKAVTLTLTLSWSGQSEGVAANLAHGMRAPITFLFERAQQSLFNKKPDQEAITPEVGQIVCFESEEGKGFGQVVEVNDETCLVSDFGQEAEVPLEDILSAWTVNTAHHEHDKLLKSYRDRCKRRDVQPSWMALTQAVGEAFGKDGQPGEGAHALTKSVVEAAVEILAKVPASNVVPLHPPEVAAGRA